MCSIGALQLADNAGDTDTGGNGSAFSRLAIDWISDRGCGADAAARPDLAASGCGANSHLRFIHTGNELPEFEWVGAVASAKSASGVAKTGADCKQRISINGSAN